jgi:signal transduction histidine kinase
MERWELSDERKELLDTLLFSAQHLQSLVDDVLDYAKIEAGALEMDMLPLDLRRLLHGVAQAERLRAMQKGTALRLDIDPTLPAELVLYTIYARACDPVPVYLKAGGAYTDAKIIELVQRTCWNGLRPGSGVEPSTPRETGSAGPLRGGPLGG